MCASQQTSPIALETWAWAEGDYHLGFLRVDAGLPGALRGWDSFFVLLVIVADSSKGFVAFVTNTLKT